MVFPILGGNSAVANYQIDNSLRFNTNDSAFLTTHTIQLQAIEKLLLGALGLNRTLKNNNSYL
jgi:hypothetical protein